MLALSFISYLDFVDREVIETVGSVVVESFTPNRIDLNCMPNWPAVHVKSIRGVRH